MDREKKERIRVPLLGFAAMMMSLVAFVLVLCAIVVVIRLLFVLG